LSPLPLPGFTTFSTMRLRMGELVPVLTRVTRLTPTTSLPLKADMSLSDSQSTEWMSLGAMPLVTAPRIDTAWPGPAPQMMTLSGRFLRTSLQVAACSVPGTG
jgi:hypothetical protein